MMATKKLASLLFYYLLVLCLHSTAIAAQSRIALVIGNSNYQNAGALANPVNDARLMSRTLQEAGFQVETLLDADLNTMRRAVLKFGRALRKKNEAGVFFYAGHGLQVKGENYLVPVDATIEDEDEIELQAVDVNAFLRVMNSSATNVNIVILDACRNNPFARSFRSASQGLATVDAPKGTFIAYSTSPGDVAADGDGDNSPYTKALAESMSKQGLDLEDVFKHARRQVLGETSDRQTPWETSSLTGDFFFHAGKAQPEDRKEKVEEQDTKVKSKQDSDALTVFMQIKDSESVDVLETYAKQFPNSAFAELALAKARDLARKIKTIANQNDKKIDEDVKTDRKEERFANLDPSESNPRHIDKVGDTTFVSLGEKGIWGAWHRDLDSGDGIECSAIATPENDSKNGVSYFYVTNRIYETKPREVRRIAMRIHQHEKDLSKGLLTVGAENFEIYFEDQSAFLVNTDETERVVELMQKEPVMLVGLFGKNGDAQQDFFPLNGLKEMIKKVDEACR